MEHSNIIHTCTEGPDWKSGDLKENFHLTHTGFERRKLIKKKQTNERNAEKYLQILNIHYIQTRGLLGCHHGDDDGVRSAGDDESPAVPSIAHAVEFLGRGNLGYVGFKMPIDSSVGHHEKLQSYT